MKTADIFTTVTSPSGQWRMVLKKPIRTVDTARCARDAILSAVTPAESAANAKRVAGLTGLDLGRVWVGDLTAKLNLLTSDRKKLGDALGALMNGLVEYSTAMGSSEANVAHAGELVFGGGLDEERSGRKQDVSGHAATPDEVNELNKKFWADKMNRAPVKDGAGRGLSTHATGESINAANKAFWDRQPTPPGRPWGKG